MGHLVIGVGGTGFKATERAPVAWWQPSNVSERLQNNSGIQLSAGDSGVPSAYVIVPEADSAQEQGYRNMLLQAIRGVPSNALNAYSPASEDALQPNRAGADKFRITYIAWRDLIPSSAIASLVRAGESYNQCQSRYDFPDPRNPSMFTKETLHVLPGEVSAVGIEARIGRVVVHPPLSTRWLDYDVIQLLEDMEHVKLFARALAWGVVTERAVDVDATPVIVYGFNLPGGQVAGLDFPEVEYWLTLPGSDRPSLLEALLNWTHDRVDTHPAGLDAQGRRRPTAAMGQAFASLQARIDTLRETSLHSWLEAHNDWLDRMQTYERELYERLPAERQKRASLRWAEASYLHEQVIQLRAREQQAPTQKEKDAIAMLMVLLWEYANVSADAWQYELRNREDIAQQATEPSHTEVDDQEERAVAAEHVTNA